MRISSQINTSNKGVLPILYHKNKVSLQYSSITYLIVIDPRDQREFFFCLSLVTIESLLQPKIKYQLTFIMIFKEEWTKQFELGGLRSKVGFKYLGIKVLQHKPPLFLIYKLLEHFINRQTLVNDVFWRHLAKTINFHFFYDLLCIPITSALVHQRHISLKALSYHQTIDEVSP